MCSCPIGRMQRIVLNVQFLLFLITEKVVFPLQNTKQLLINSLNVFTFDK